jgi:hypothetical protein
VVENNPNYREIFENIKKSEGDLLLNSKQLGSFLISQIPTFPAAAAAHVVEMISKSEAMQDLSNSATAIISGVNSAISPAIPFAALIPIALFALRFANGTSIIRIKTNDGTTVTIPNCLEYSLQRKTGDYWIRLRPRNEVNSRNHSTSFEYFLCLH